MSDAEAFFAAAVGAQRLSNVSAPRAGEHLQALVSAVALAVSQGHANDAVGHLEALPRGPERDAVATDALLALTVGAMWGADMATVAVLHDRARRFLAIVRSRGLMEAPRAVLA